MYTPGQDGPDPNAPDRPASPAPITYEFLGRDQKGVPMYRGSDGTTYTDGPNGAVPYTGQESGPVGGDYTKPPTTTDPTPPAPPTDGGGSGAGTLGTFTPPPELPPPGVPEFHPPDFTPPPAFQDPSMADVQTDPGYAFARDEGQHALEASKAAQGVYNTGGTLKDLIAWGGNFAQQRYGDVRNRKMDTYNKNYQTQTIDPYHAAYTAALDQFNPKLKGYETESAWNQHANDMNWQHAFDLWNAQYNRANAYYGS